MHSSPRMLFAFVLGFGLMSLLPAIDGLAAAAFGQSQEASLKPVAAMAADIPFQDDEFHAEQQLLALANQARRQAGVPALKLDTGLSRAARIHALTMLESRQLSHQFRGEPALPQRLAAASSLILDHAGENVALDYDAEHGHQHLMLSPPASREPAQPVLQRGRVGCGSERRALVHRAGFRPRPPLLFHG